MSYRWIMHPGAGVAELVLSGELTEDVIVLAHRAVSAEPGWLSDYEVCILFEENVDLGRLDLTALESLRDRMRGLNAVNRTSAHPRTALICRGPMQLSIARLWAFLVEPDWPVEIAVFEERDPAFAWVAAAPEAAPQHGRPLDALAGERA